MRWMRWMVLLLFAGAMSAFTESDLPKGFTEVLNRAQLHFDAPAGMVSTKILNSRSLNYDYAVKLPDRNFEIRYAIRPTDILWKDYSPGPTVLRKGETNTNPDSVYISLFQTITLNCSGGELPEIREFEKASVQQEFGADWGGTVIIKPRKEFGQDYKYCMIVGLHKNRAGDAFIFYLSDTQEKFNELILPAFHALKFAGS